MKKSYLNLIIGIIVSLIILSGCATAPKIKYTTDIQVRLVENIQAEQKQEGITIKLEPIDDKEYEKSYYTQKFGVIYTPILSTTPGEYEKEFKVEFYYKLTPFQITIFNDTDHILRMRDSRVVFIDPGSDEPIMAFDKQTILDDIEILPIYDKLSKSLKQGYPETAQEYINQQLLKNITKIVKKLKFVNAFNREIMPGMKYSGIIVFPVDPVDAADGKISFIDMISETDSAGNPTKKVRFDYYVKSIKRYWRYNPETDTEWKEISESEYNAGQTQP